MSASGESSISPVKLRSVVGWLCIIAGKRESSSSTAISSGVISVSGTISATTRVIRLNFSRSIEAWVKDLRNVTISYSGTR